MVNVVSASFLKQLLYSDALTLWVPDPETLMLLTVVPLASDVPSGGSGRTGAARRRVVPASSATRLAGSADYRATQPVVQRR